MHPTLVYNAFMAKDPTAQVVHALPHTWRRAELPEIAHKEGRLLDDSSVQTLGLALRWSSLSEPQPYLQVIRKTCTPESLSGFSRAVIDLWHSCNYAYPNRWFANVVHLAPAAVADQLIAYLNTHDPAVRFNTKHMIQVLAASHCQPALRWLRKHAATAMQPTANAHVETCVEGTLHRLADQKGLTFEALLDDEVPTLGLSKDSTFTLEISSERTLTVQLFPDGHVIKDQEGLKYASFPVGRRNEDNTRLRKQRARYRDLLAAYNRETKEQSQRFEEEMLQQGERTWARLREHAWENPVLRPIVESIIWITEDITFRMDESGTPINAIGDTVSIEPQAKVSIPHPLNMDADTLQAWSDHLSDFEIFQSVDQIGRATYPLNPEDLRTRHTELGIDQVVPDRGWNRQGLVSAWGHFGTITISTPALMAQIDGEPTEGGLRVNSVQFHAKRGATEAQIRLWASEALRSIHLNA